MSPIGQGAFVPSSLGPMSEPGHAHSVPPFPSSSFAAAASRGETIGEGREASLAAHAHCGTAREPGLCRVSARAPAGSDADGPAVALCGRRSSYCYRSCVRRLERLCRPTGRVNTKIAGLWAQRPFPGRKQLLSPDASSLPPLREIKCRPFTTLYRHAHF